MCNVSHTAISKWLEIFHYPEFPDLYIRSKSRHVSGYATFRGELDETDWEYIELLKPEFRKKPRLTTKEIRLIIGMEESTVRMALIRLREKGWLRLIKPFGGMNGAGNVNLYELTEKGRQHGGA